MPETEAHPCPKTPRWSAERCASLRRGTRGASQAPGLPRQMRGERAWFCVEDAHERAFDAAGRTGARNTRAALGAPLPSVRGTDPRSKLGRLAPRERDWLFDIVRGESSARVLGGRSQRMGAKRDIRTRACPSSARLDEGVYSLSRKSDVRFGGKPDIDRGAVLRPLLTQSGH